jgi:hypothetical protein
MEIQSEWLVSQAALAIGGDGRQVDVPPSCIRRYLMKEQVDLKCWCAVLGGLDHVRSHCTDRDSAKAGAREDVIQHLIQDGGGSGNG